MDMVLEQRGGYGLRGKCKLLAAGVLAGALLLLSACDQDRLANTQPGLSTEQEVLAQWGQPERVWTDAQGQRVLEYSRQPNGAENYMITIGPDGRVVTLQNVLTRENFVRIQPGMHMEEVRRLLGRPASAVPYDLKGEIVYQWRWREGTGGAPFKLFIVTTDRQFIVKRVEQADAPTHSEQRNR
ncbi:MAG: outer membrane protein assembly factor BamE [Brachymonas sp.]|nr:outer membrane protein assembly factor BamE [Brachymonas sp.]